MNVPSKLISRFFRNSCLLIERERERERAEQTNEGSAYSTRLTETAVTLSGE